MRNVRRIMIIVATAVLLLIPYIAMQFTDEVNWTLSDFVVAGALLLGAGFLCEYAYRKIKKTSLRVVVCVVILVGLFLMWGELAVGLF